MVGLKVYKVKNKETYNRLHIDLSGSCFFRNEGENYFIKAPLNETIKTLINLELISDLEPVNNY
jgi:hypothetical protein|tara:strand:- start:1535 stop:1726 length:192 start_codon:yes stop_codon:yes gene_type:complete